MPVIIDVFFLNLILFFKVEVHVNPSNPPAFLQSDLKPEHLEHLKVSFWSFFWQRFDFEILLKNSQKCGLVASWKNVTTNIEK